MRLRPHHLLCVQSFCGKGYSEGFIKNMSECISRIENEDNLEVTVISGTDDLCAACPNRVDGIDSDDACHAHIEKSHCIDDRKVLFYDQKVCDIFGVSEGRRYIAKDLIREIKSGMTPQIRKDICGTCSWYSICGNT